MPSCKQKEVDRASRDLSLAAAISSAQPTTATALPLYYYFNYHKNKIFNH